MFNIYNPSLEAPTANSPSWYTSFHNGFYLSQVTNGLLLSGLSNISRTGDGADLAAAKIVSNLEEMPDYIKTMLFSMGIDSGDSFSKEICIDPTKLLASSGRDNWHDATEGFLNLWEFLFIFSLIETTLKGISNVKDKGSNGLINAVFNKYPSFDSSLTEQYDIDRNYCCKLWDIYKNIRDIYSHSHGIISTKNVENISTLRKPFIKSIETYLERLGSRDPLAEHLTNFNPNEIFDDTNVVTGNFYLLNTDEMNIFRNFACHFMSALHTEYVKDH